jgi:chromatin structure-remodeling complex subunit RSC3/30
MIFDVVEDMWSSLEDEELGTGPRAFVLSKRLFETYTRPLQVSSSMIWEDFQSVASGRWEVIGLLFTLTGLATDMVSHNDPIFTDRMDAKSLAVTATVVGDICLQFCDSCGIVNDIVSWLLQHQLALLVIVYGGNGLSPGLLYRTV